MSSTTSLTGLDFSMISTTAAIVCVEPLRDLAQREDRGDEVVDEREHDQHDRDQQQDGGTGHHASSTITSSEPP